MNRTFYVTKVLKRDVNGLTGVIDSVEWAYRFEKDGQTSDSIGETMFNAPDAASFVAIGSVTKDMIESWVRAVIGGDAFFQEVEPLHEQIINAKIRKSESVEANLGFIESPSGIGSIPSSVA